MFHGRKVQVDFKKATQKFLDAKRECRQRASALRVVLDNFETHEAKVFFQRHYSEIYYICHDYFSIVEVNLRQKANKAVREDLDCVLYIFEKILLLLPELVHERWQFASIGRTMLKLLHHGNAFKLRSEGIRLLILWLQALQENMDISCEVMFACVVPGFPNPLDTIDTSAITVPSHVLEDICNFVRGGDGASSSGSMTLLPQGVKDGGTNGWCSPDELQILVPLINQGQAEKIPGLEDLTKVYLDRVLDYMITQIGKIEWLDKSMRKKGFECLFNLFKKYYLHHVFPMWNPRTNLYATNPEQVQELDVSVMKNLPPPSNLTRYADSVVKWFVAFLSKIHVKRAAKLQHGEQQLPKSTSQSGDSLGGSSSESQLSTLSESSRAAAIYEDTYVLLGGDIILDVICSTRENVHIVHEVFRQAFILPMEKSPVIKEVLVVYYNWLKYDNKPKFMLDPDLEAISNDSEDVRAGMQGNVRLLIYHSSFLFLTPTTPSCMKLKVYYCERVILMYRNIVLETSMVAKTWEQLLVVLLTVAKHVLEDKIVEAKHSSFAGRLASTLLQTLFVTWIRANLNVTVSVELWDRFLDVVSSLTHWSEVVSVWKQTMDTLTSVIAVRVYGLNLKDLPLDRLSEQKHKKRRHQFSAKNKINDIDRTKMAPSPCVQESKPEVTSSSAAPVSVVPTTSAKTAEPVRNEGSTSVVPGNLEKQISGISDEPETSESNLTSIDAETSSQNAVEQGSEKGYESDSESEVSITTAPVKSSPVDTDMSLMGTIDCWPGTGTSASREGSLNGEKGTVSTAQEDNESLNDSSNRSDIDTLVSQEASEISQVDGKGRQDRKKTVKTFWKDSDGADDISSDSELVPPSFSNPMHEDTSFDNDTPVAAQMMDDQTVPLEIVEPSVHSLDMDTEVSVVCGGTKEGWTPVAAVVLWTRMLGVLGNVNYIESATIHAQVLTGLSQIWHLLAKIRLNQGISEDNKSTPCLPNYLPPLHYFASWLFQAVYLPQKYKPGRLIAYQLLCEMTVRRQDKPLSEDYLRHFYRCLHDGLTNADQDIINAIMGKCDNFFGMVLPSSSLLILDFIYAANRIIDSANTAYPRTEAVTILGSLLCYPNAFPNMKIYQIGSPLLNDQPTVVLCRDIKDKISDALYRAAVTDPDCHARCTALCAVWIFIVEELTHNKGHGRLHHYTSLLLTSIMFKNWSVSSVAVGLVQNLSEYRQELSNFDHDLPLKILQVLCEVIRRCVNEGTQMDASHVVKILNPLMSCLLDWVMVIPLSSLLKVQVDDQSTLAQVFQALKYVVSNKSGKANREFSISRMISREDLQIHLGQIHQDIADSAPSSPADFGDSGANGSSGPSMDRVRKTAKAVILHIINHLNHFPLAAGAARLTSLVNESHDNPYCNEQEELTAAVFSSPNVQFFVVNDSSLISMVELPNQNDSAKNENLLCGNTSVRLVVRDMCGKHCLDISTLFGPGINTELSFPGVLKSLFSQEELNEILDSGQTRSLRRQSSANLQPDKLDQLLKDIGTTSPECLFYPHLSLNEPAPPPYPLNEEMEQSLIEAIQIQREKEEQFCENAFNDPSLKGKPLTPKSYQEPSNPFHLSHSLFNQLGMFGWEKRSRIDLLKKSDMLILELKHLDNRKSRETHKIAVFYVAPGQEDKTSIMSNTSGSKEYEDFVAGLAWEVELSTHTGFMGGLDKNQSTGTTAVYYANSTVEVMFHVATRMPVSSDEGGFIKKVRHLGNDEIWIVWSEHSRDFRHGIVNAEFGDVVIIIYPLQNHLFRIQILKKGDIPYFGPLFDGAIVDRRVLPPLVRMTAVNASRAKRSLIPGMQTYYEERASCISNIVNHHKETTVFEDFAEQVFCPVPRKSEENNQVFSISSHLRKQVSGGESPAAKREGYSTLPSAKLAKAIAVEKEVMSATMSLPEGLHKVVQADTVPAPKLGGKKMSFRRKPTPSTKEENTE